MAKAKQKAKSKKKQPALTDTEIALDTSTRVNIAPDIFDRLTEIERRFLCAFIHDEMSLVDAWRATHPRSRASEKSKRELSSQMWKSIRDKISDNPRDYFEAVGLGMNRLREVIGRNLDAQRAIVRQVANADGVLETRVVQIPDGHVQLGATKVLIGLLGYKKETIEHTGAVGVSMSDIHAANEDTEES